MSPHKTSSPHRRKLQSPSAWKNQPTLHPWLQSSPGKNKIQSTMYSYFGPAGLASSARMADQLKQLDTLTLGNDAPTPTVFRYDSPTAQAQEEEVPTTLPLRSQEVPGIVDLVPYYPGSSYSTAQASPSSPNSLTSLAPSDTIHAYGPKASPFLSESQVTVATVPDTIPPRSVITIPDLLPNLLPPPEGISKITLTKRVTNLSQLEIPTKRKFDEFACSHVPNPLTTDLVSDLSLDLDKPFFTAPAALSLPTDKRSKHAAYSSPEDNSPQKKHILGFSPRPCRSTLPTCAQDVEERQDEESTFQDYDPLSDVEEIRELRRRSAAVPVLKGASQQAPPTQPGPLPEFDRHSMALDLALASRIPVKSKRRPYLSRHARSFLVHLGRWEGFRDFGVLRPLEEFTGQTDML